MPYISVHLCPPITRAEKERVIGGITQVMVDVLGKDPNGTYVVLNESHTDDWGDGGRTVSSLREIRPKRPVRHRDPLASLATGLRSLVDPSREKPLSLEGLADLDEPMEVSYRYQGLEPWLFDEPVETGRGLLRFAPLLPPLRPDLSVAEGATPLLQSKRLADWAHTDELWLKLESHNPTGSHKDRFNLVVTSAAVDIGARGLVLATSGNHGASAAAYAARANLPCIALLNQNTPAAVRHQTTAYGGAALLVPWPERFTIMGRLVREHGFHPVSNSSADKVIGHPYGPEGYKTIAYEVYRQLGSAAPAAVYAPTAYAELLFGLYKGFLELKRFGRIPEIPHLVACEPASRAPLTHALAAGQLVTRVEARPTEAYSIGVVVNSLRGALTLRASAGRALGVSDDQMRAAQRELGREGIWAELSACAGLAALRQDGLQSPVQGPAVCLVTGSGCKDLAPPARPIPEVQADSASITNALANHYGIHV